MAELVCRPDQHQAWLDARRQGVTATDVVTLAGLASWDSPFALYWRKKGVLPEVQQSPRMRLGLWLEDAIAEEWFDKSGWPVDQQREGGLYRSSDRPWQLATPDVILFPDVRSSILLGASPCGVLEVKTASSRDGWGEDGSYVVPARVRAQVLWQMDVMGVAVGRVAVCFLPSGEIRSYTITHPEHGDNLGDLLDCPVCAELDEYRDLGFGFMDRLMRDEPPPVDGLPATTEALKHLHANYQPKTAAHIDIETANPYIGACYEVKRWEEVKRRLENLIRYQMGDAQLATWGDEGEVFARREVYKRREYVVPAGMVDRLVRVKPKEDQR